MSEFLAYGEATWHSGIIRDAIAFHTNITKFTPGLPKSAISNVIFGKYKAP